MAGRVQGLWLALYPDRRGVSFTLRTFLKKGVSIGAYVRKHFNEGRRGSKAALAFLCFSVKSRADFILRRLVL